jgi:hypothetical protein
MRPQCTEYREVPNLVYLCYKISAKKSKIYTNFIAILFETRFEYMVIFYFFIYIVFTEIQYVFPCAVNRVLTGGLSCLSFLVDTHNSFEIAC